jgi:WD40 repeat protein
MPDERFFISYSTNDGGAYAAKLRLELSSLGFSVWQDLVALKGGRDWWSQIENALRSKALHHLILVVTPGALESSYVRREIRLARQEGKTISPVRGPGFADLNMLPRWLGHIYDLDDPKRGAEHRQTLMRVLEAPSTQRRVPMMAPEPPADFVQRPVEFNALKKKLLDAKGDSVAITAALRGAGGYGKTTLAKALAHDPDIEDAYFDGILWVELGEKPENLLSIVADLIEILSGERPGLENLNSAAAKLGEALGDRRILLVIDDAWREQDLRPFLQGGRNTTRLITTRLSKIVPLDAQKQQVDAMRADEARALLSWGLPREQVAQQTDALAGLAARLGEWAQLLKLVNGFLRDRVCESGEALQIAIEDANWRLAVEGLTSFDENDESIRTKAVAQTINLSLGLLEVAQRARFEELAVFPEDVDVPIGIAARLWRDASASSIGKTKDLLTRFFSLSLLVALDLDRRTFRFHDTVRGFLQERAGKEALAALHKTLLKTLDGVGTDPGADDASRRYYFLHRLTHLDAAGEHAKLASLLGDPDWLQAKLEATDSPQALISDYERFGRGERDKLVLQTLRLISGICARDRRQLLPQLYGRLLQQEVMSTFRAASRQFMAPPALLTYRPSLAPPFAKDDRAEGHGGGVYSLAILQDGRLASGSSDGIIRLWDIKNGVEAKTGTIRLTGHRGAVRALALLPDGRLASGSADSTIRIWDTETGKETAVIEVRGDSVRVLAVLPDGRLLSGSDDSTIRFWDSSTGVETARLVGEGGVRSFALMPDGVLASGSGSADSTVRLWDIKTGAELARLECNDGALRALTLLPDGRLAVGSNCGTIWFWDPKCGADPTWVEDRGVSLWALSVLPDDRLVAGWGDSIKLFDIKSGLQVGVFKGHDDWVRTLAVLLDGNLASGSDDGTIRLWDIKSGSESARIEDPGGSVRALEVLPNNYLASGSSDRTIGLWNVNNAAPIAKIAGHRGWVNALVGLPDGRLASGAGDGTVRLWNVQTGAETARLEGFGGSVRALTLLPDSRLASGSGDSSIRLWDIQQNAETAKLEGFGGSVRALAVLQDGRLASGSDDSNIRLWDVRTNAEMGRLAGHRGSVRALAALPDGRLISGSSDGSIRVWNVQAKAEMVSLLGHRGSVRALLALPDDRLLSVSGDSTIRLWNVVTATELSRLEVDAAVLCLAALCDGRFVAGDMLERLHWIEILDLPAHG